jgi:osmotically-inducible protein OsmY
MRTVRRVTGLLLLLALPAALSGCVSMVIGAGATVGVAAAEERGISGAATDVVIQTDINDKWIHESLQIEKDVYLTVHEGRVLLAGTVATPEMRLKAVQLVWEVNGVREVIDEIKVGDGGGIGAYARDVLIANELRTKLLFDRNIQSINYNVETVGGVVYLMGIAQNQAELDRVTGYARNISYVQRVVSYVRLKSERIPPIPDARPVTAPPA